MTFAVSIQMGRAPVEVSTTTGLLLGDEDDRGMGNVTRTWSYTEKKEGIIELRRVFSPIIRAMINLVFKYFFITCS